MSDVAKQVIDVIAECAGVDADQVKPEQTLVSLYFDSLDQLELVMELEEHFGVEINDDAAEQCKTVADVVALVERTVGGAQ